MEVQSEANEKGKKKCRTIGNVRSEAENETKEKK